MHDTSHGTEGRGYHPCQKSQRDSQGSTTMLQVKQKLQYAVSYSDRPPSRAVGTKLVACCFSLESSFFWVEDELALDVEAVTLASLMLFSWLTSRSTGSIRAQQANCRGHGASRPTFSVLCASLRAGLSHQHLTMPGNTHGASCKLMQAVARTPRAQRTLASGVSGAQGSSSLDMDLELHQDTSHHQPSSRKLRQANKSTIAKPPRPAHST